MSINSFDCFLGVMSLIALFVFVALYFIKAGYGIFRTSSWGPAINNRVAWILMESPVFIVMLLLWLFSERRFSPVELTFFIFFQLHYFQRSFIFPFLMTGKSKMPLSIMLMGVVFNVLNGFMQGEWIFYLSPSGKYDTSWFGTPMFIIGTLIFFTGMVINLHSDNVIRHLRKPGDTRHYLPAMGLYRYVTSANYFGETLEWGGWALLTFSWSGLVFFWWTFANLVPRANAIWKRYHAEFGDKVGKRKRIFPYIY
jgi:3-oxo-5-alpha-steroid 4-dehydrogenase 1